MPRPPRVAILEKQGGVLHWHLGLAAGLREAGAEVALVQLRPVTPAERRAKRLDGASALENPPLVARVAAELRAFVPDLVVLLKRPGLPEATAARWREAVAPGVPFVGWICDHYAALPAGNAPALDGVYHFDSATRPMLDAAYAGRRARIGLLPLAVDPADYRAEPPPFAGRVRRLVFAGRHSPDRRRALDDYRALGGEVDGFGPKARVGLRLWRRRHLPPARLARLYSGYFATLNLLQSPNTVNGLNLRAYEIPAAGGLATYPLVPDLPAIFVPGEEVVAYRDLPDLKTRIDSLLANPARAEKIAAAGRARVLREHTFAHRARRILADWLA